MDGYYELLYKRTLCVSERASKGCENRVVVTGAKDIYIVRSEEMVVRAKF